MISTLIKTTILMLTLACVEPLLHHLLFSPSPRLTLEDWSKKVAHNIEHGSTNAYMYGKKFFYQGITHANKFYQTILAHQSTRKDERSTLHKKRKL